MSENYNEGKSGVEYEFRTFEHGALLPDQPGIYYIADSDENPLFIERTDNFRKLIGELSKKSEVIDLISRVHFHLRYGDIQTSLILEDLKEKWKPRCTGVKGLKNFIGGLRNHKSEAKRSDHKLG